MIVQLVHIAHVLQSAAHGSNVCVDVLQVCVRGERTASMGPGPPTVPPRPPSSMCPQTCAHTTTGWL